MSFISKAEQVAEKIFSDVEAGVKEVDGAALRDARDLLAKAAAAEQTALSLAGQYKTEIEALAAQVAPEVEAELSTLAAKILADLTGLFGE